MVGTTISHYKVLEEIGQGGMGTVYRAEDANLGREVAIKVVRTVLEVDSVAGHHALVEGEARFRAIPPNELVDGMVIPALRLR